MITDRCNMKCRHCCYSCTEKGMDMTRRTFVAACRLAESYSQSVFIGGGEPTLHKYLFDFIGLAIGYSELGDMPVGIITNGKLVEPALRLAKMARYGMISAELSIDEFHEPINPKVVKAFEKYPKTHVYNDHDGRGHRHAERLYLKLQGRAQVNKDVLGLETNVHSSGCVCPDLLVAPNGVIYHCGCRTITYGTVFRPNVDSDYNHECYKTERTA